MGTRHLSMVVKGGKIRVAQYGQWDGYPGGAGIKILNFLKICDMNRFKKRIQTGVRFTTSADRKERKEFLKQIGVNDEWLNMEQSTKYNLKFPFDSRDIGADILELIYNSNEKIVLNNAKYFAYDGLFCEWLYLINLDTMMLEVYSGFHKTGDENSRFGNKPHPRTEYLPVQLLMEFDLNNLPSNKDFCLQLEQLNDELYLKNKTLIINLKI